MCARSPFRAYRPLRGVGQRRVPLPVFRLRSHVAELADQGSYSLVFPSRNGTPLDPDNTRSRMLKPLMGEALSRTVGSVALVAAHLREHAARGRLRRRRALTGARAPLGIVHAHTYVHLFLKATNCAHST
jgi:hypothetical protein